MPIAKAIADGTVLAEATTWEEVEGNIYFPHSAIKDASLLVPTDLSTFCPWKGHASYYSVVMGDKTIPNAAWYYAEPYDAAMKIKGHVAFYTSKIDVTVE
ncbi:DUF427 domain-containing protein [Aspergillus homomorphus CBS 101889]|uniref:DUF427 domain protein n=1 Tax=Aspergillus homomorphus (strain CBS 101889) TaxID=1450537 RepID=A0A395HG51_ASPHC|nr:DUF427 domain protein [Aspergillus homomorphus CBS 101889]RAL06720.1 DUF427 domain protein [Aspergillus homomorphus CBS 101889]